MRGLQRRTHFLGAKVRKLRKANGLTLEDLSMRCVQLDAAAAPSVSYLSLIETGRRVPSTKVLDLLARVFQRPAAFFMDDTLPDPASGANAVGPPSPLPLEPAFLFSKSQLEMAIPELLSQTGTSGRQFAHLLIRAYQERRYNRFPDLERAAEEIGRKQFPLHVQDLERLCERQGLTLRWFDRAPFATRNDSGRVVRSLFRSFFEPPSTIHVNSRLQREPSRLKYDLACHLAHKVLHGGDGRLGVHATGGELGGSPRPAQAKSSAVQQEDVLSAWRDFESSFFAGALLCPKQPFRHFLVRRAYDVFAGQPIDLTPAVLMRRMTAVSPYRHWHYFDAYPPGYLRAVYRANRIPLPWGNMRLVSEPCRQWGVFRALADGRRRRPLAQLSLLEDGDRLGLYADISVRARDAAGNPHVICAGIDLAPSLRNQGVDPASFIGDIAGTARGADGEVRLPATAREQILATARVLQISWVADAAASPVVTICPRSSACPRARRCEDSGAPEPRVSWVHEVRDEILAGDDG